MYYVIIEQHDDIDQHDPAMPTRVELFRQGFAELDLARVVTILNTPKRGRKPNAKKAA